MLTHKVDPRSLRPLAYMTDDTIRQPLWLFSPSFRPLVLHERRRRFGIDDERIDPDDLIDEEVTD